MSAQSDNNNEEQSSRQRTRRPQGSAPNNARRSQQRRPAHAPAHQAQRVTAAQRKRSATPQQGKQPQRRPVQQQDAGGSKTPIVVLIVALVVVVALGVVLFLTQCSGKRDDGQTAQNAAQDAQPAQDGTDAQASDAATASGNADDSGKASDDASSVDKSSWELTLVNKTHPLPADWKIELAEVADGKYVDARIADQFNQMIEDCRAAGFTDVFVNQAYRSHEEQQAIWDEFYNQYIGEGYSAEEATKLTGESVAVPGTSEHELGLAADICSIEFDETYNAPIQTWLRENGHKYGFIQRYPEGKESITGTKNENWHFRYVGVEAAKQIYESGQVLEEYLGEVDATS